MTLDEQNESLYSLYRRGMELLEDGDFEEATGPLKEAARQAPEKSSVRRRWCSPLSLSPRPDGAAGWASAWSA